MAKKADSKVTSSRKKSTQKTDTDILKNIGSNGELNFKSDKKKKQSFVGPTNHKTALSTRIFSSIISLLVIGVTIYFAFDIVPNVILANTDEAVASRSAEAVSKSAKSRSESIQALLEKENQELSFTDQKVKMSFEEFGDIIISMRDQAAPQNVENFLRLTSRGYYDDTTIHRMVEGPAFNIIQGGDPEGNGTGGETADGEPLLDEIWAVAPEYRIASDDPTRESRLVNTPEFADPSLYPGYSTDIGLVNFPRGLIMMANTGAPNSATSQFFITLEQTVLPPSYTVFGVIDDFNSLSVLDTIREEVDPDAETEGDNRDGKPNKDITVSSVSIATDEDVTQIVESSATNEESE